MNLYFYNNWTNAYFWTKEIKTFCFFEIDYILTQNEKNIYFVLLNFTLLIKLKR